MLFLETVLTNKMVILTIIFCSVAIRDINEDKKGLEVPSTILSATTQKVIEELYIATPM